MGMEALVRHEDPLQLGLEGRQRTPKEEGGLRGIPAPVFRDAGRLLVLAGAGHHQGQGLGLERLGQIVEGSQLHGLDRSRDTTVPGHHHRPGVGSQHALTEQIDSTAVGQIHVDQDEVEAQVLRHLPGPPDGVGTGDVGTQTLEGGCDVTAQQGFILHHEDAQAGQDGGRHGTPIMEDDSGPNKSG